MAGEIAGAGAAISRVVGVGLGVEQPGCRDTRFYVARSRIKRQVSSQLRRMSTTLRQERCDEAPFDRCDRERDEDEILASMDRGE